MTVLNRNRICRRLSPKGFALTAVAATVLLCIYYTSYTSDVQRTNHSAISSDAAQRRNGHTSYNIPNGLVRQVYEKKDLDKCPKLVAADADISTLDVFKEFEFQPSWMRSKEYWDKTFEDRYERQKMDPERPPLKVIIVPHSHNDPGWLKTFESYFHVSSRQIMSNMVAKLQEYNNLTFIWSEISFLNSWWEEAHPSKQKALKDLVHSGRLEITTGGWVMTDEANVHLFAMVDQLIEGLRQFEERHTAVNTKLKLENMMTEWGLLNLPNIPVFFTIRYSPWRLYSHALHYVTWVIWYRLETYS